MHVCEKNYLRFIVALTLFGAPMMRTAVSYICFALFPAAVKVLRPASSPQWAESAVCMDSAVAEQVKEESTAAHVCCLKGTRSHSDEHIRCVVSRVCTFTQCRGLICFRTFYRVITKEMTEIKHVLLSHGVT
jgi:hypothetical protein